MTQFYIEKCTKCLVGVCCSSICDNYRKFIYKKHNLTIDIPTTSKLEDIEELINDHLNKDFNVGINAHHSWIKTKDYQHWMFVRKVKRLEKLVNGVKELCKKIKQSFLVQIV